MPAAWFVILALMLTAYAVLDGFDFGAGVVHLFVAKTDAERRSVLAAIGPLWDGNEVWLIASGGVFIFAFPAAYAAAFSGLYLALMVMLWLLVFRGIAIELRSMVANALWRAAWDGTFALSSSVMAVVLGVALGNVVRGVPLDASGYFHEDLFAGPGAKHPGALDPFTAVFGVFSLVVLSAHGATFLAWKTAEEVGLRSRALARRLWIAAIALAVVVTLVTAWQQPSFFESVVRRPWLWGLAMSSVVCAAVAVRSLTEARDLQAFLGSCGFIVSMLLATAGALYPTILRSTLAEAFTIDMTRGASPRRGLAAGLVILMPALALAITYFSYLFRSLRGKAEIDDHHGD